MGHKRKRPALVGVWCLESAFGFLPGLNVGPYGGRGISMDVPIAFVSATGEIPNEHRLWRKNGLGAEHVVPLEDVYGGVTSGRHADTIQHHVRSQGDLRLQYFYVGQREADVTCELGLSSQHVWSAKASVTQQIESKIAFHRMARLCGMDYIVVPARICSSAAELHAAHATLMRVNHTIKSPDFSVFKRDAWASGVGTAIVRTQADIDGYGREHCNGQGTEILAEAGYADIVDAAVQMSLTDDGVEDVFVNAQIILHGKDHAGNLVASADALPGFSKFDLACLQRRGRRIAQIWWLMGYRGQIGCDAIGICGKKTEFGSHTDLTRDEITAMRNGQMLDWRFVDPNPRMTASQYPKSVLNQLEAAHGGAWAVLMSNVWPASGAVSDFAELQRTIKDLLPDGDEGVLPLMTGLLPGKFSLVAMSRHGRNKNAALRVQELLQEVRHRVGG